MTATRHDELETPENEAAYAGRLEEVLKAVDGSSLPLQFSLAAKIAARLLAGFGAELRPSAAADLSREIYARVWEIVIAL